jgi:UDP-N-acetylglucosamine 2-epimerase (non-hydrolysing)|tara:strand:+ start:4901 stop:6016 length:1116 start_codon:yes stop_codon:yes gene_type:complete
MHDPIRLMLVAGARPNFMKIAPIVRECDRRDREFSYSIIHTGQHYDASMSDVFFEELGIPAPDHHLNVGSGDHSEQTAKIMQCFDPICRKEKPDCVVVVGDVNSTLACTIVAKKLNFQVAHVEAGLRSGDRRMPEEINRLVTDAIADYFFVTEQSGMEHLAREGHSKDNVFFVGHVMIDNLFFELERLKSAPVENSATKLAEDLRSYGVVTLHRPSNVDDRATLKGIIEALNCLAERIDLIFSVHPRTRNRIKEFELSLSSRIHMFEPLSYRSFLQIWKGAQIVLTDSGGLQEETTALGIPCLTLRENTERPATVEMGSNRLCGPNPDNIISAASEVLAQVGMDWPRPPLWDGLASKRILDALETVIRADS